MSASRSAATPLLYLIGLILCPIIAGAQTVPEGPYSAVFRGAPLVDALEEVVELTGIDLVYNAELTAGLRSYCAERDVSAEALLACALRGTGLDFVRSSSGAYVLIVARQQRPPPARLTGRVVDAKSGEPMPYAHVLLADGGTVTNGEGYFAFANLPPGRHRITSTYVGYETATDELWLGSGSAERVTIQMRSAESRLAPVVVDGLTQRLPSARLGLNEAPASPGAAPEWSVPDVMRGAAATIGVSAALPLADLHIQGGSTTEHVTRLDGVPVRDPVSLGRYLGAFSPLAVGTVTIHKAGFGVEHGSLLSGAIDVRHDLDGSVRKASFQADPLSVNARISVPLEFRGTAGGSALLAFRRSTWDVYQDAGIEELLRQSNIVDPLITSLWLRRPVTSDRVNTILQTPDVAFSDVHAALRLRPDAYSTVSASLFRAGNFVAADHSASLLVGDSESTLDFEDVYDWTNWAGQVRYSRLLGARAVIALRARGSLHTSSYGYAYSVDHLAYNPFYGPSEQPQRTRDAAAAHRLVEGGLDAELAVSLGPGHDGELGVNADLVDAHFEGENAWIAPYSIAARELQLATYARGRYSVGPRLSLEGGTRVTAVPSTGEFYAEPRAAARYDGALSGTDGYALRVASGLYRQFVNGFQFRSAGPAALVSELWFWLPTTAGTPPPRNIHLTVDGLLMLNDGWTLRAETFGRLESRILALDVGALMEHDGVGRLSPADVVGDVDGRAFGGGLEIQWRAQTGSAAMSYSFEQARRSVLHREAGARIAVPWEEPHRLSFDGSLNVLESVALHTSFRGVWGRSWGLRHAYYDFLVDDGGAALPEDLRHPEGQRLPPLLLVDAKAAYTPPLAGAAWRIEVGVANLMDRQNVMDWSLENGDGETGRIPRLLPGRRITFLLRFEL